MLVTTRAMLRKRLNYFALLGVLGGLGLASCGDQEQAETKPEDKPEKKEVVQKEQPPTPEPVPVEEPGNLEDVAKAMGFAKFLPKETHTFVSVYDGKGFVDGIRKSKIVQFFENMAAQQGGPELDDVLEAEEGPGQFIIPLLSEEFFMATGDGSPETFGQFTALNEASNRHMMKFMISMLDAQLANEDGPGGPLGGPEMMMPFVGGFLGDPKAGLALLEKFEVPPIYLGFKVSDEDMRNQLGEMATGGLMQLLEQVGPDTEQHFADPVTIKRGDHEFTGVKLDGAKAAALITDDVKEGMAEMMDAASIDKLINILKSKTIVIAVGLHGDYLLGFAGTVEDDLQFAATPAESVLARPEMDFMKTYAKKKLLSVVSMSKDLLDASYKEMTILGSLLEGVRDGLAEAESFGDVEDIEVLIGEVIKREKEIMAMNSYHPASVVAFLEEGLKIETYGGTNMADLDLVAPRSYASLGEGDDVFLFSNWVSNPEMTQAMLKYLDAIGETIYLGARYGAQLEIEDNPDYEQFKEGFGMFEANLKGHLLELWKGLRGDLVDGLGQEGAIIVDLKGELPTVPGIPQELVDGGKAPRIGILTPISDGDKLSASWVKINTSVEGILKFVSEMAGENIPMQKPMTSEKNDLKTWFFPFPFQTDEFVLSVSMDKKNFFASTSKSFVQDLSARLEKAEVEESQTGMVFDLDLTLLEGYVGDWVKLMEANADQVFGEGSPKAEDFKEQLPVIKEAVASLSELKGISASVRKEGSTVRSSVHFKVAGEEEDE